jgi:hypothetical protein
MYSSLQNAMLCVNCFRDLPNEIRAQCVDIDTAHTQAAKRLERGQTAIMDLQVNPRNTQFHFWKTTDGYNKDKTTFNFSKSNFIYELSKCVSLSKGHERRSRITIIIDIHIRTIITMDLLNKCQERPLYVTIFPNYKLYRLQ